MALITCPECTNSVSDLAEACPKCGYPLFTTESTFVEVYFNGEWMYGEKQLKELWSKRWEVVDTDEFVDHEGVEVTRHKLQKKSRTTRPWFRLLELRVNQERDLRPRSNEFIRWDLGDE